MIYNVHSAEDFWSLGTLTIVCTFLTFVEATITFKMFQKKNYNFFLWVKCYPLFVVGNNFYLNVFSNHCSCNQPTNLSRCPPMTKTFVFLCLLKKKKTILYLSMHCFFSLLKVSYCTFYLSGCSTACSQVVDECMCACVNVSSFNLLPVFDFQHAVAFD